MIASGSVGLAAVVGSFAGGILDRRHAREMARTDRSQTRLESTYLELISYVHRSPMAANNIRPFVTYTSQPEPVTVTAEVTQRAQALVVSDAGPTVRDILDEFGRVLARIHSADAALTGMESKSRTTGLEADPTVWMELERLDDLELRAPEPICARRRHRAGIV